MLIVFSTLQGRNNTSTSSVDGASNPILLNNSQDVSLLLLRILSMCCMPNLGSANKAVIKSGDDLDVKVCHE